MSTKLKEYMETPTASLTITTNATTDVTNYASVVTNVINPIPVEISTDAGMTAVLVDANIGKAYKFTGTTGTYTNGDLYIVELPIPSVITGGTATGVVISSYTGEQVVAIKNELIAGGKYTAEDLDGASIFDINGTTVGTVILDVSTLGAVGDYIKLIQKLSNNIWETLFDGEIPSSGQVTVTLTSFSPIVGMESEPQLEI